MITADLQPLWPGELTAWGTLAVATVAVAVALFAEWRAGVRVRSERKHAATVLAGERKVADDRLTRQLEHSDQQLAAERKAADERLTRQLEHSDQQLADERKVADERLTRQLEHSDQQLADERKVADDRLQAQTAHSDQQLREERQQAQDALQLSEAYTIRVIVGQQDGRITDPHINADPDDVLRSLAVVVVNEGRFAVTDVAVGLYNSDGSRTDPAIVERIADYNLPDRAIEGAPRDVSDRTLAPAANGLRFAGNAQLARNLTGAYPVVRWTDHWDQMWERSKGRVRKTSASTMMTAWP